MDGPIHESTEIDKQPVRKAQKVSETETTGRQGQYNLSILYLYTPIYWITDPLERVILTGVEF